MTEILRSDGLGAAKEIDVFEVALSWAKSKVTDKTSNEELRTVIQPLLVHVRLPLISATDMALRVSPSKLLVADQELALYSFIATQTARSSSSLSDRKEPPAKIAGFSTKRRKPVGTSFTFDPNNKGNSIVLSNNNRTMSGKASSFHPTLRSE
jgi:hypothetical protein